MKKNLFLVIALVAGVVAFSAFAATKIQANSNNNAIKKLEQNIEKLEKFELPDVESAKEHPSSLYIGPQGQVRIISGEITEIGTTTPVIDGIKAWGINLKVDVGNAKFIPSGTTASSLKVGDKVNVKGTINKDTGVITASTIHSLSATQQTMDALLNQIRALIVKIRELQQKAGLPLTPLP
jgi:hypothetical protein